jgi:hypothetical protein
VEENLFIKARSKHMNTQRNVFDRGNAVSPAIREQKGTWFLGRRSLSDKGTGPYRKIGSWFMGRKTGAV